MTRSSARRALRTILAHLSNTDKWAALKLLPGDAAQLKDGWIIVNKDLVKEDDGLMVAAISTLHHCLSSCWSRQKQQEGSQGATSSSCYSRSGQLQRCWA